MLKNKLLFGPLLIGVLMVSLLCHFLWNFTMQKTISHYEKISNLKAPSAFDFWIGVAVAGVLAVLRRLVIRFARVLFMKIMKEKYVGDDREERSVKSAMNFFKFLYYVLVVSVTY